MEKPPSSSYRHANGLVMRETKVFWLLATHPVLVMADACLSQPQLVGVIFGSVGATLAICLGLAGVFWFVLRKTEDRKTVGTAAYTNGDVEGKHCETQAKVSQKDQVTMIDSFKLPRKLLDTGTQKSFSVENVNEVRAASGKVGVLLKSENAAGFGMTIQGNMNEGIYVKEIVPMGAAYQTGNILPGDRIKTLSICFDNMVYEDALTLLSYASPYRVKFELERKIETPPPMEGDYGNARLHPLFRSNTLTHIQFNPISSPSPRSSDEETEKMHETPPLVKEEEVEPIVEEPKSPSTKSDDIEMVEQKTPESTSPEPLVTKVISEVADSTTIDTDMSKMESSDYASDNTSEYRESESDCGNGSQLMLSPQNSQHTISDRVEITDVIADKPMASPTPPPPKVEYCKELPPKPKSISSRSPSPRAKLTAKSPSPVPPIKEENNEAPAVPHMPPPAKKNTRIPSGPATRTAEGGPPEFTEARTSRIPKRGDSIKTPIIERKLPALPKSVTHRSQSAEDKERADVWSRLYLDKKAGLKKTREIKPPTRFNSEHEITSTVTSPPISPPNRPTATDLKFSTLDRERRERLAANQNVLDRQTEELRKLGVL